MPIVSLFGNLRRNAKVSRLVVPGTTARAVLQSLCADNAALSSVIFDHNQLRPYLRVLVNGRDIELTQGLDTPLESPDQIAIFPPIAGGTGIQMSHLPWRERKCQGCEERFVRRSNLSIRYLRDCFAPTGLAMTWG
jgi:molybdopterin synthase sulfur carrier subunit